MPRILMRCICRESSDEIIHIMIKFLENQLEIQLKKNRDIQSVYDCIMYIEKHILYYRDESMDRK